MPYLTLTHPDHGDKIEVEYEYHPAHRGCRDKYGAPEEPDECESVLIVEARAKETGELVSIEGCEDQLTDAIFKSFKSDF